MTSRERALGKTITCAKKTADMTFNVSREGSQNIDQPSHRIEEMGFCAGYNKYRLMVHMVAAAVGIVVGCSACVVFARVYQNVDAAMWAGVSALFATLLFSTSLKVHRDQERLTPISHFTITKWLGFVGLLAGIAGFFAYIILGVRNNEKGMESL